MINFSGNSGKSTLAENLFFPRMKNSDIIRIETFNSHGGDSIDNIPGKKYDKILEGITYFQQAIVDVGSSNVQDLIQLMKKYDGSHHLFQYFIVPTLANPKQIKDTIQTIESLLKLGIDHRKIRIIFNRIQNPNILEQEFSPLFLYNQNKNKCILNQQAIVYQTDFYDTIQEYKISFTDILKDQTNYNLLLQKATTLEKKIQVSHKRGLRFLAKSLKKELDDTFRATFEKETT
jgi:hypothetical protein